MKNDNYVKQKRYGRFKISMSREFKSDQNSKFVISLNKFKEIINKFVKFKFK